MQDLFSTPKKYDFEFIGAIGVGGSQAQTYSFITPRNVSFVFMYLIGGGAGGGGGRGGNSGANKGGGGGGSGSASFSALYYARALPSRMTILVGNGGLGGAGGSSANGTAGTAGTPSLIRPDDIIDNAQYYHIARTTTVGGAASNAGGGGTNVGVGAGGATIGELTVGYVTQLAHANTIGYNSFGGGVGTNGGPQAGGNGVDYTYPTTGRCILGGCGGGGVNSADTSGGTYPAITDTPVIGVAASSGGTKGSSGYKALPGLTCPWVFGGTGGGGNNSGTGGAGGDGVNYGAGGGGGGAGTTIGGRGGDGGPGYVRIICW